MDGKYFKIPVAAFEQADALTKPLFGNGSEFIGPLSERHVVDGFVYVYLHDDPNSPWPSHRQEAWTCAYLLGDFADNPAYEPPEGVVEITQQEYLDAFPPSED